MLEIQCVIRVLLVRQIIHVLLQHILNNKLVHSSKGTAKE